MPSSAKAYQTMLMLTENTGQGAIYDLGSGWGTLALRAAARFPDRKVVGYELSLLPYLVSIFLKQVYGANNLTLYRRDFMASDLSEASVLLCYLYPGGMSKVSALISSAQIKGSKLSSFHNEANQLNTTTRDALPLFVISNNFSLPDHQPEQEIRLNDFYHSPIYRYRLD